MSLVHRAGGPSRNAIVRGIAEIDAGEIVGDDQTRGDPDSPLRWICKSTRTLAHELCGRVALRTFADAIGLPMSVCHFPPGTSTWNKIEHRLFSCISSNWRGESLRDYETVITLIATTTTAAGLTVTCRLDRRKLPYISHGAPQHEGRDGRHHSRAGSFSRRMALRDRP